MRHQISRRDFIAIGSAVVVSSAAFPSAAAANESENARLHGKIMKLLRHMTTREKVGQLFVVEVYGQDAETASEGNRALYGVDTPAQVIDKYKPGGIIYFDTGRGADNLCRSSSDPSDPRSVFVTGWGVTTTRTIGNAIAARGQTVAVLETGLTPAQARIDQAVAQATQSDLVVVSTNNVANVDLATGLPTPSAAAQQAFVNALLATGKPVIVSAMRNPYDISRLTAVPTYLATYGYTAHSIESMVRVLFGETNPAGRLPVTIVAADGSGPLYPFGHGLSYGG